MGLSNESLVVVLLSDFEGATGFEDELNTSSHSLTKLGVISSKPGLLLLREKGPDRVLELGNDDKGRGELARTKA